MNSPFIQPDSNKLNDENYFRGLTTAQLTHIHACIHRIEGKFDEKFSNLDKRVVKLDSWKGQVIGGSIAISGIVSGALYILTMLFKAGIM